MKATEVVVEGALTEDGQLVLDEKPNLPPGRVKVWLRKVEQAAPAGRTMFDAVAEIWEAQAARGYEGRPTSELLAELDAMRDEWDSGSAALPEGPDVRAAGDSRTPSEAPR